MSSVSFIVPVYNKSRFLKNVVESLKNQKGSFRKEFIFIDDGSTDNSYKRLLDLTKRLTNCKILRQKNKGSANATNLGIRLAKMKYIKFLDADDIILSQTTASLLKILENDQSLVLAFGLQRKVSDLDSVNLFEEFDFEDFSIIKDTILKSMRNSMFNPSQCLARTEHCRNVGGCDERIGFSQEYSLTLRLSVLGKFARLNYPVAILPLNARGQISEKKNNQIYRVSKALELFLEDNPQIDMKYKLYAQRRLTARSWRFARRFNKSGIFSLWFRLYLKGLFREKSGILENCKIANKVYENFLD
jgi:glycosyltransferase involved in cell wall biosynthesis